MIMSNETFYFVFSAANCSLAQVTQYRAYERGLREVHYIAPGPGRTKVRTLRFSIIKPKLMVAFFYLQRWYFDQLSL